MKRYIFAYYYYFLTSTCIIILTIQRFDIFNICKMINCLNRHVFICDIIFFYLQEEKSDLSILGIRKCILLIDGDVINNK